MHKVNAFSSLLLKEILRNKNKKSFSITCQYEIRSLIFKHIKEIKNKPMKSHTNFCYRTNSHIETEIVRNKDYKLMINNER